jgi:hypothetical protein
MFISFKFRNGLKKAFTSSIIAALFLSCVYLLVCYSTYADYQKARVQGDLLNMPKGIDAYVLKFLNVNIQD